MQFLEDILKLKKENSSLVFGGSDEFFIYLPFRKIFWIWAENCRKIYPYAEFVNYSDLRKEFKGQPGYLQSCYKTISKKTYRCLVYSKKEALPSFFELVKNSTDYTPPGLGTFKQK